MEQPKKDQSGRETYNTVTDTVTGVNVRWRDNLYYGNGSAWEYNAWAVPAVGNVGNGNAPDGTPGQLLMNGLEYSRPFDVLHLDFYAGD